MPQLNLRDNPVAAGYSSLAQQVSNFINDGEEDEDMNGDNGIQELKKYFLSCLLFLSTSNTTHPSDCNVSPSATITNIKQVHSSDKIDTQVVKAQKLYKSQGHLKAKNYDDMTQEVLTVAITIYHCLICTNMPYPDHSQELEFVKIGWRITYKKVEVKLEMTPELVKMVCMHCSSTHPTQ